MATNPLFEAHHNMADIAKIGELLKEISILKIQKAEDDEKIGKLMNQVMTLAAYNYRHFEESVLDENRRLKSENRWLKEEVNYEKAMRRKAERKKCYLRGRFTKLVNEMALNKNVEISNRFIKCLKRDRCYCVNEFHETHNVDIREDWKCVDNKLSFIERGSDNFDEELEKFIVTGPPPFPAFRLDKLASSSGPAQLPSQPQSSPMPEEENTLPSPLFDPLMQFHESPFVFVQESELDLDVEIHHHPYSEGEVACGIVSSDPPTLTVECDENDLAIDSAYGSPTGSVESLPASEDPTLITGAPEVVTVDNIKEDVESLCMLNEEEFPLLSSASTHRRSKSKPKGKKKHRRNFTDFLTVMGPI